MEQSSHVSAPSIIAISFYSCIGNVVYVMKNEDMSRVCSQSICTAKSYSCWHRIDRATTSVVDMPDWPLNSLITHSLQAMHSTLQALEHIMTHGYFGHRGPGLETS